MAPPTITEDYYMVLEVAQDATPQLITKSYRRLALKLHPDRNVQQNTTEAFQLLGQAYETLNDQKKRQEYDLIYPSLRRSRSFHQNTQTWQFDPAWTPRSEYFSDVAQIAKLNKSKEERAARWHITKTAYESTISELQKQIWCLEQEIRNLDSIAAAEVAEGARKNSWGAWLLSPIYKIPKESDEEKARKDIERQERRIEKDMKERRLESKKAARLKEETLLRLAKHNIDDEDLCDNRKIRNIENTIRFRALQKQREKEKVERERMEQIRRKEQEERMKREQEVAAAWKKQQEERRNGIDNDMKRNQQQRTRPNFGEAWSPQASASSCRHGGWWSKVQGRTACPECHDVWTYLLACPGCSKKACPKCQAALRPRFQGHARTNRRARPPSPAARYPSPERYPSPDFVYHDWD